MYLLLDILYFFFFFLSMQTAIDHEDPPFPRVLYTAHPDFVLLFSCRLFCFFVDFPPRRRRRTGHDTRSAAAAEGGTEGAGAGGRGRGGDAIEHADKNWRRLVSSCEHADAPHYGKGFCRPCYMVSKERESYCKGRSVHMIVGCV